MQLYVQYGVQYVQIRPSCTITSYEERSPARPPKKKIPLHGVDPSSSDHNPERVAPWRPPLFNSTRASHNKHPNACYGVLLGLFLAREILVQVAVYER